MICVPFYCMEKQGKSATNHLCFVCFMEQSKAGLEQHEAENMSAWLF